MSFFVKTHKTEEFFALVESQQIAQTIKAEMLHRAHELSLRRENVVFCVLVWGRYRKQINFDIMNACCALTGAFSNSPFLLE